MVALVQPPGALTWNRPLEKADLPDGCTLALDPICLSLGEDLLAGGAPFRIMRLSERGQELLRRWGSGEPLDDDPASIRFATRLVRSGFLNPSWETSHWTPGDVTIVIPHRNDTERLEQLLQELHDYQVIVVDDASDHQERVREICERIGIQFIERSQRGGPGAARNSGLSKVATPFTFFLDTDCSVSEQLLVPLLTQMNDPNVAVVAPRITGPVGKSSREQFEHSASPLDLGLRCGNVRPGGSINFVPSAALLVRTSLGPRLFDESLNGGEDVDLIWRLVGLNWTVRYESSVIVEHDMRDSLRDWVGQRHFYGTTAAVLEARHGDSGAPLRGSPWSLAAWSLVGLGHPVAGLLAFMGGLEALRRRLDTLSDHPGALAWELTKSTALSQAPALARTVVRTYGPAMIVGSLFSKRLRRLTLLSYLVAGIDRWQAAKSDLDLTSFVLWSTLDDLSYGTGVWHGAFQQRRIGALIPRNIRQTRSVAVKENTPRLGA